MLQKVNFVIDADIRSFFDNVDHEWLMEMLQVKIADKNFFRIIKRFLLARVRENGNYNEPTGVPLKAVYAKLIQQIQRVGEYRRSRIRKNLTSGSVRGMTNSSH
jgi:retron-type reverse transcriptase